MLVSFEAVLLEKFGIVTKFPSGIRVSFDIADVQVYIVCDVYILLPTTAAEISAIIVVLAEADLKVVPYGTLSLNFCVVEFRYMLDEP